MRHGCRAACCAPSLPGARCLNTLRRDDHALSAGTYLRLSARLDPVRARVHSPCRHAGHPRHWLWQHWRDQRAAHRPQGPRRRDSARRYPERRRRGAAYDMVVRARHRAGRRNSSVLRASVSGLARLQGRQGHRHGLWLLACYLLERRSGACSDLDRGRGRDPLFVGRLPHRIGRGASYSLFHWHTARGTDVPRARNRDLHHASRQHRAALARHRGKDRPESRSFAWRVTASELTDDERIDWLRLIRSDNIGPRTFKSLLQNFGSARAALGALPALARRGGATRPIRICPRADAEREFEPAHRLGANFVGTCEAAYPRRLAAIDDAPPLIAVRGNLAALTRPMIAIVGSRNASAAGLEFAERL